MNTNLNLHRHVWLPREGASHTVVALHGTGGDENDLVPLVSQIYPNANILGVRGNVTENGYPRFFRRFAEGMFDEADITFRVNELAAFWNAAAEAYGLSAEATTWLGYSNGANTIAALLLQTNIVRDAVLLRAQAPFKAPPEVPALNGSAKVHLVSGAYDTIVPTAESRRLRDELEARGYTVGHSVLETGHQLSQKDLNVLQSDLVASS